MNLSRKIVLVIISTFIALVFIVAVTSDVILLNSFANLEKKVLRDNVLKVSNEIEESFSELEATAKDYVEQFQQEGAEKIATLGLGSFTTHRIDFIGCYGRNGEFVAAKAADFHSVRDDDLTLEQHSAIQQAVRFVIEMSGNKQWYGFINMGANLVQLAIRPFGTDSVMVVGKCLDSEEIQRVAVLTKFTVDIRPYNAANLPEDFSRARTSLGDAPFYAAVLDNEHIAGYSQFNDIYGKPVMLLKILEKRQIYEQGKASITYILLALIISGGVFCGVTLLFIRGAVLKRLATLISTVGDISRHGDISERLEVKGEDELEDLAVSINSMLTSLESAERALKESEERYRALFERAPDSIFIIDTEGEDIGRIANTNRAACEQHGYSYEELCSMRIQDLNTPETNQISTQMMESIMRGEWVTQEVWHYKKDGSQFPIEVHAGLIKLDGRNYILGFDRDITSRKLAEESDRMYLDQIRQLNMELGCKAAELSVANKELESFNYSVSHDMRGPLTRISGYCQVMLDDSAATDVQIKLYLTRIYESCCWLDEMIDAMLKLSQLARTDFVPVEVNLSMIVESILNDLAQAEPKRSVEAVIAPDVKVIGDTQLLKIMASNLINNSWKYSAGTEHTRIEFGVVNGERTPVYFVRDNGSGFDMKDADKLFRVFTRLHERSQFSGSGIGLATVQRVITRHGGRVWAEGEVGRGATFFFTLVPDVLV